MSIVVKTNVPREDYDYLTASGEKL
jgi:hypothetical protein